MIKEEKVVQVVREEEKVKISFTKEEKENLVKVNILLTEMLDYLDGRTRTDNYLMSDYDMDLLCELDELIARVTDYSFDSAEDTDKKILGLRSYVND